MTRRYNTQALVLKKTDRGEADRIITFYTKEYGKLQITGKAIRKMKSKLKSTTDLFYLSDIDFIQGKSFKTLTDAREIDSFCGIRSDFEKTRAAFKISEEVDKKIIGEEADKNLWRILIESFKRMDSSSFSGFLIYHYFAWSFLSVLGYEVNFDSCSLCGGGLNHFLFFDSEQGFVCSNCSQGKRISSEAFKVMRLLAERDWDMLKRVKISKEVKKEISSATEDFISSV